MRLPPATALALTAFPVALSAAPALAQRVPFERTLDVPPGVAVDVTTLRGKIEVTAGAPGKVVVGGAATVRIGPAVPADALKLAEAFAANPAIEQHGAAVRLTPPADEAQRRAITVNYTLRVPPDTKLVTTSDSGATTVTGVAGPVSTTTQSGAIELRGLGGDVQVRSGSGAVAIDAAGGGSVDVETGSSAIDVTGVRGAVRTVTRSGHTKVRGTAGAPWDVQTGSGAITAAIGGAGDFGLDAVSGSGSVKVHGMQAPGTSTDRAVTIEAARGGPLVRLRSRSGSITLDKTSP